MNVHGLRILKLLHAVVFVYVLLILDVTEKKKIIKHKKLVKKNIKKNWKNYAKICVERAINLKNVKKSTVHPNSVRINDNNKQSTVIFVIHSAKKKN